MQHEIELTDISSQDIWYYYSWKGDEEKLGGVATNRHLSMLLTAIMLCCEHAGCKQDRLIHP